MDHTPIRRRGSALAVPVVAPARRVVALVVALALAAAMLVTGVVSATPSHATSVEDVFTRGINKARAERGIPRLETRPHLVSVARSWAATMARQSRLYHNPDLTSDVNNWRWVGENVGYGPDALTIHVAFMNSPGHLANILDRDYTQIGVGAVTVGGRVWVAEVFRRPMRVTTSAVRSVSQVTYQRALRLGSTGPAVKRVQARLGLRQTGYYDQTTKAAVSRFQKRLGWVGRGYVGRRTWGRLF